MNYITIITPDNIEIEYRLAGPGSRIAAACIDLFVQTAALVFFIIIFILTALNGSLSNIYTLENIPWFLSVFLIITFVIVFVYYIAIEIITDGQTIGKKLLKLRVIRDNGAPIGLVQSLIRNCIKLFVDIFGIGIAAIILSKKSKRLGDMAAGTIVVACNPQKMKLDIDSLISAKPAKKAVNINNKLIISAKEKRLLQEYFANKDNYTDKGESAKSALASHFANKFRIPDTELSEPVLKWIMENN